MKTEFFGPRSLIKFEREYASFLVYVISTASTQYKNSTILALNRDTVKKFADAKQTGNYASIFQKLSNAIQKKILDRFSDEKVYQKTKDIFDRIDKNNEKKLYEAMAKASGISIKTILQKENKKPNTKAIITSTAEWASKTLTESLQTYSANTLRAMTLGQDLDDIAKQFDVLVEKRKGHAAMVARTQVSTFNALCSKVRAQNLGITKGIWQTAEDDRVRKSHEDRDGKEYELTKGLYSSIDSISLLPGVDYRCRCVSSYVIPSTF